MAKIQTWIDLELGQSQTVTNFKNAYNRRFQKKIKKREAYSMILDLLKDKIEEQTSQWNDEFDNFLKG